MKRKELTPEQLERRRLRARKYYQKHREQILAHNREHYRQKGCAWHAERIRKYRQQHRVSISRKTIGEYCYRAIEKIQKKCPERADP